MWWWYVDSWLGLMCCALDTNGGTLIGKDVVRAYCETICSKRWDLIWVFKISANVLMKEGCGSWYDGS